MMPEVERSENWIVRETPRSEGEGGGRGEGVGIISIRSPRDKSREGSIDHGEIHLPGRPRIGSFILTVLTDYYVSTMADNYTAHSGDVSIALRLYRTRESALNFKFTLRARASVMQQ